VVLHQVLWHPFEPNGGIDTLQLEGADLTLDLTKIRDRRIQDIEVIDMTGSGDNTLYPFEPKVQH
jgi:hypothetical protein